MSKIGQYIIGFLLLLGVACQQEVPGREKVLLLKEMGELASTQYTLTKLVKANDNKTWYKIGDRKILLSVEAKVKAGIDLASLKESDIQTTRKSIHLDLPAPHIISMEIDPASIKEEYEDIGILRMEFSQQERNNLLIQAEKQINASIPETGILETTRKHTREWIRQFCTQLGYEEVVITFKDQASENIAP